MKFAIACLLWAIPILSMAIEPTENAVRVTLQSSVISLDPGGVQDTQSLFVSRQINCQLVRNEGSFFVLDAAESIKYITPLQIQITISKKANFHDSSSVTAEDVVASLDYIKKSRNIFRSLFILVDKVVIADQQTVIFVLKKQAPQIMKVLSSSNFTIFKKDFLYKAMKNKALWKKPLGCGGYKVDTFDLDQIKLTPIKQGLPIKFYLIKSNQLNADEMKNYDLVTVNVIGKSKSMDEFDVLKIFDPVQYFIGLNSKSKIWKNQYERCHFLSKINTNDLIASYDDMAIKSADLLPKGMLGYNASSNFYNQINNLGKFENNKPMKSNKPLCLSYLTVSIQEKNKVHFFNMIKNVYPNITIKPIKDVRKFGSNFVNENCDALLFALRSNYYDGYEFLTIFENNDANFTGLNDVSLSNKITASQNISDTKSRALEYHDIVKNIANHCVVLPLFTMPNKKVYLRKNLKAQKIGLVSMHQYYLENISR